jgi:hypothetical protein
MSSTQATWTWWLVDPIRRAAQRKRQAPPGRYRPVPIETRGRGCTGRGARPTEQRHVRHRRSRPDVRPLPGRMDGRQAVPEDVDTHLLRPPHRALSQARTRPHQASRSSRHRLRGALRRDAADRPAAAGQALPHARPAPGGTHQHEASPTTTDAEPRPQRPLHRP